MGTVISTALTGGKGVATVHRSHIRVSLVSEVGFYPLEGTPLEGFSHGQSETRCCEQNGCWKPSFIAGRAHCDYWPFPAASGVGGQIPPTEPQD